LRVLLLNQTFYPDVAATAQQATDLAAKLVERGHEVTVVCGRRAYDNAGETYAAREEWRGVHIRRISSLDIGKTTRWRRGLNFGTYIANCMVHLAALPGFDLVVAMTSPPLISWLGAMFTALAGGRFVVWVMDLNPDEALAAGWLRPGSWTTKRLSAMLNFSLNRATSIVVLDRFMARRIHEKGIPADKITTLPPWSHDHLVRYDVDGREAFRRNHGLDGKYVVMYSGNHSPCHPLSTLLEAARHLSHRDDIAFCFVGGGSEFRTVRSYASEHRLGNVRTIPYQPREKLSASLSAADVHVVVMGEPFVGLVHPCKVYNIRTLGIPYLYIGPAESHLADLDPTFTASHGEVNLVAAQIVRAAEMRLSRVGYPNSASHSHDSLVGRMALTLERSALIPVAFERIARAEGSRRA
jgi:hypothetical protein